MAAAPGLPSAHTRPPWRSKIRRTLASYDAAKDGGDAIEFDAVVRIDTPGEADYYRNGGILQYVLRNMLKAS